MLPDADVLSFKFGVAYGNVFGHRGFTHSLVFAFVVPLLCVLIGRRWFRAGLIRCWLFLTVSLLSHSLLDSVTTGGKGVGWLWPWSDERFFAPRQVIKVAPFALSRYTTPYGHQVIISELMWVWLRGWCLWECCGGAGDNRMRKLASGNSAITYDARWSLAGHLPARSPSR